jgi:hypothetical protein
MPLTWQHIQETLCLSHIYAVAGMAGVDYRIDHKFDYGVDGEFRPVVMHGKRRRLTGFPLDFQAKASVKWTRANGCIAYDLEAKTYNDMVLRTPEETTLRLILLCLPRDKESWHEASYDDTKMRHCCYWHVLTGLPTANDHTQRIFIPTENLFTPDNLNALLEAEKKRLQGVRNAAA